MDFDVGVGDGVAYGEFGFDVFDQNFGSTAPVQYEVKNDQAVSYGGGGGAQYVAYDAFQPHQNYQPLDYAEVKAEAEPLPEPEPEIKVEDTDEFRRSKPQITISNVVSNFRCRCHLNLRQIAIKNKNVIYKRDQGKVMMKLREPQMMANIWSSGKIVCQGAKSEDDAKRGSRKFARIIQQTGFPNVRVSNYKVVNVLGNCRVPFAIDIMQFSSQNAGPHCSYEPELHPAVTFKPGNGATIKIFSTGALTILGRNVDIVQGALDAVYPLVYPFRKRRSDRDVDFHDKSDSEEF